MSPTPALYPFLLPVLSFFTMCDDAFKSFDHSLSTMSADNNSGDLSILCRLESGDQPAGDVLAFNQKKADRVFRLSTEYGIAVEMLQVRLEEPRHRRRLLMFGRYPRCSIQFPNTQISLHHCYIDLSGVLMLYDISRHPTMWLKSEQITSPPYWAMVPYHAQSLRVHGASFQIHWPEIAQDDLAQYQSQKLALAKWIAILLIWLIFECDLVFLQH